MNQFDKGPECPKENTLTNASDEVLTVAAKAGNDLAYAELCRRHSAHTLRAVQRITRNKEDAEDAMQDSLLKAYIHAQSV